MLILNYIILASMLILGFLLNMLLSEQKKQRESNLRLDTLLQTHHQTFNQRLEERFRYLETHSQQLTGQLSEKMGDSKLHLQQSLSDHRSKIDERQLDALKILQDTLLQGVNDTRLHVKEALGEYARELGEKLSQLTQTTELKLNEINNQVEKRLTDGFEKTTATFTDVIKRLALIDAAQKQISELSTHVVSLQEILNDKRSRGAFGEIQLSALIRNVLPEPHFSFQHLLSNGKRPDCVLFLPEPSGNIVIDAKFPLENFKTLIDSNTSPADKKMALQQFKINIRKHINDIAEKYIIPGETADGAMMFIPAEAIFAEIHANHPDLVEMANRAHVWLVSPTTIMAILTTARAVLKDAATREQLHIIQQHLHLLATDFKRFETRMNKLANHIEQAHTDVSEVHISAKKITQRFGQIEKVDLVSPLVSPSPILILKE